MALCVPSGKAVIPPTAVPPVPPLVKGLDNYECFSVMSAVIPKNPITSLSDQFEKASGSAFQPLGLCAPAQIGGSALLDSTTHLVCLGVKLSPAFTAKQVSIHNRFGVATAKVFARQPLCLPSTKKLG